MIDTGTWKEFCVGELFSCETTLGIPSKNDLEDGNINYITRSAIDNGFSGTCGNEDHKNKGNCISIGAEGFVAFWQSDDFVAGNKVYALRHPNMNEINGLFVCSALNAISDRYSFADARVLDKIKAEIIKLPATSDSQPDWDYMESYMKSVMEESEKSLENLKKADGTKHLIDVSGWGEFSCRELFECKNTGNILARDVIDGSGDTPYVTASGYNNGVVAHIDASNYEIIKGHCILVGGKTFTITYQKDDFVSNDSHNFTIRVKDHDISDLDYLYLASMIYTYFGQKYSWNDAVTKDKLLDESIPLPITLTGEPNWRYMEDYMKDQFEKSELIIRELQSRI